LPTPRRKKSQAQPRRLETVSSLSSPQNHQGEDRGQTSKRRKIKALYYTQNVMEVAGSWQSFIHHAVASAGLIEAKQDGEIGHHNTVCRRDRSN
jgi:hypothetical protein